MFDGPARLSEKSANDIVARVRRPAFFALATKEANELHDRGVALDREVRRLIAERGDDKFRSGAHDARIIELERERAVVASAYREALGRVSEHRPAYAEKVNGALSPWRLDAATRALAAADALEAAVADLIGANRAAAAAGIEAQVAPTRPDLSRLRAALHRTVELAGR